MSITYQNKALYINTAITQLTTSNGSKADTPEFFYKSATNITWTINDGNGDPIDVSGGVYEFKINETYNGTNLITVADGDFTDLDETNGVVSCVADFNQPAIQSYLNNVQALSAECSLWCTLGGVNYLLVAFECSIYNTIY